MLTTHLEMRHGVHLIHLSGALDSEALPAFHDILSPLVHPPRVRMVLDCQDLQYINSKGLGMLGRHQRIALQHLCFLGIAALSPRIVKTIHLLGIKSLTLLYDSVEEALQAAMAFSAPPSPG